MKGKRLKMRSSDFCDILRIKHKNINISHRHMLQANRKSRTLARLLMGVLSDMSQSFANRRAAQGGNYFEFVI